jgi:hypothetical protein
MSLFSYLTQWSSFGFKAEARRKEEMIFSLWLNIIDISDFNTLVLKSGKYLESLISLRILIT